MAPKPTYLFHTETVSETPSLAVFDVVYSRTSTPNTSPSPKRSNKRKRHSLPRLHVHEEIKGDALVTKLEEFNIVIDTHGKVLGSKSKAKKSNTEGLSAGDLVVKASAGPTEVSLRVWRILKTPKQVVADNEEKASKTEQVQSEPTVSTSWLQSLWSIFSGSDEDESARQQKRSRSIVPVTRPDVAKTPLQMRLASNTEYRTHFPSN